MKGGREQKEARGYRVIRREYQNPKYVNNGKRGKTKKQGEGGGEETNDEKQQSTRAILQNYIECSAVCIYIYIYPHCISPPLVADDDTRR